MLRRLIFIPVLLFCLAAFCQGNHDSLMKYSYLVYNPVGKQGYYGGTGFFIKNNKNLFFVTAQHVLDGYDMNDQKLPNFPDTAYIVIHTKTAIYFHTILLADIIKKHVNSKAYEHADVYVLPVRIPDTVMVNSIEKFMVPILDCHTVSQTIVFGYPVLNSQPYIILNAPPKEKYSPILNYCYDIEYQEINKIDSFNYPISIKGDGFGFSGAPIFFEIKNKPVFGGIVSSGTPDTIMMGLRPKYIEYAIKLKKLNQK